MTLGTRGSEVYLAGVEGVSGRGVQCGVKLEAARLILSQKLREDLGTGGHQVGGHCALTVCYLAGAGAGASHARPGAVIVRGTWEAKDA